MADLRQALKAGSIPLPIYERLAGRIQAIYQEDAVDLADTILDLTMTDLAAGASERTGKRLIDLEAVFPWKT